LVFWNEIKAKFLRLQAGVSRKLILQYNSQVAENGRQYDLPDASNPLKAEIELIVSEAVQNYHGTGSPHPFDDWCALLKDTDDFRSLAESAVEIEAAPVLEGGDPDEIGFAYVVDDFLQASIAFCDQIISRLPVREQKPLMALANDRPELELTKIDASIWQLDFRGTSVHFADLIGFAYVAELMRRPGQDVAAVEFRSCAATADTVNIDATESMGLKQDIYSADRDGIPVFDERAKTEYKGKINELEKEISEALKFGDSEKAERLKQERELIIGVLANGLSDPKKRRGRSRIRNLGSGLEKARISVTNAIQRALDAIEKKDHDAAAYLRDRIQTGATCRFSPEPFNSHKA
jgi:hypothetical protein